MNGFTPLGLPSGSAGHFAWVHQIDPFVFRFPFPFFTEGIRWYGVAYVLGFLLAGLFFRLCLRKGRSGLSGRDSESLLVALILGILIGGRAGYVLFYDFSFWRRHFFWIFRFWSGGMSFHGALIGATLAIAAFAGKRRLPFLHLTDLVCAIAPAGIFLGRVANFINGELWGKVTAVPWAVRFPQSVAAATPLSAIPPRHPSQLYEALLEGLWLLLILQKRFWQRPACPCGQLTANFLCLYAIFRTFSEIFREPDAPLWGPFSRGQALSLGLGVLGVGLHFWLKGQGRRPLLSATDGSAPGAGD